MRNESMTSEKKRTVVPGFGKNSLVSDLLIMVVLCFAGVFCKKLINPAANVVTDSLHVPGGISSSVSLMFLVIAAGITKRRWSASAMGIMQAGTALAMGSMGSMGYLLPVAYVVPGVVIDAIMLIGEKIHLSSRVSAFIANILSSVTAALFADLVVFHLPVKPLTVYLCLATLTGSICGYIAGTVISMINDKKNSGGDNQDGAE